MNVLIQLKYYYVNDSQFPFANLDVYGLSP